MKIYQIIVKDHDWYGCYTKFIVLGNSINDMLENLYSEIIKEEDGIKSIPYYLRSSNFDITYLGEFIPDEKIKGKLNKILCSNYLNED